MANKQNPKILALEKENQALKKQVQLLLEKIAQLEKRLGLNSQNSSKPPSSEGFTKPQRTQSLRKSTGKKSGGQLGPQGHTLNQVSDPDKIIKHLPPQFCDQCGCDVQSQKVVCVHKRQVFEIPKPSMEVTEHQVLVKQCPHCQSKVKGQFPQGVNTPVSYGERIKAVCVYLSHQHFLPEERLSQLLSDLFGCNLTGKTIANINDLAATKMSTTVENIKEKVESDLVKHLDETGVRIEGQTQWLHVVSNQMWTWYRCNQKRKDNQPLSQLKGTVIHDHWKSYYQLENVEHGLCNAHHLRELKAVGEIDQESWALSMSKLLLLANQWKHRAQELVIPKQIRERLRILYDSIVTRGLNYHQSLKPLERKNNRGRKKRRVGHNLLIRLRDYKEDVLKFIEKPEIPFTNNQAERDLRMIKCKQKISGSFRTMKGAKNFATIRSVISTVKKQGLDILESIKDIMQGKTIVFS